MTNKNDAPLQKSIARHFLDSIKPVLFTSAFHILLMSNSSSFWHRPEGKTGAIVLTAATVAAGYGIYRIAPHIVPLLSDIVYAGAMAVGAAVIGFAVFDKRARGLFRQIFQSAMRYITGIFIEIDPIGVMKNYLENLVAKQEELRRQLGNVTGVRNRLEKIVKDNEGNIDKAMRNASHAKKTNNERQVQLHLRSTSRFQQLNEKLKPLKIRLTNLIHILSKVDEAVSHSIEDLREEIRVTEMEFTSMRAASKAMKEAAGALTASGVDYEFFERAKEYVEKDVALKIGQIDTYLRISSSVMQKLDFEDEVALNAGLEMLENWEKTGEYKISGTEKIETPALEFDRMISTDDGQGVRKVFERFRQSN